MVDAGATLLLLDLGGEDLNPSQKLSLAYGSRAFLVGKLGLTGFALPILLIGQNHSLFGTKFKVSDVLSILVLIYATLNIYQLILLGQV